jgi:hypothetical protein
LRFVVLLCLICFVNRVWEWFIYELWPIYFIIILYKYIVINI